MNKLVILFITAITALSLTGCWGTATETNTETADANLNPDANLSATTNIDVNVVNNPPENTQTTNQPPIIEVQTNKVGNHVRTGEPGVDSPEMKKAEKMRQYKLGPENSFISGEMNDKGEPVQTRQFGNHPTIKKVEVITYSETEKKMLVYLKNGKVLPLEPGKVTNPMTASSYDLLKAVGVEVKTPAQTTDDKKEEQKKKEQN